MTPSPASPALDRSGAFAIGAITLAQALLLFIPHGRWDEAGTMFSSPRLLFVWYTVALLAPGVVVMLLRSARDAWAWSWGLVALVFDGLLAWYTGSACVGDAVQCGPVVGPYIPSMAVAHFILLPFVQVFRDHGRALPYQALFHHAWDNALTLAATGFFVGVAWLILQLWAALFEMVGIDFFRTLFRWPPFCYAVTGLLAGVGIVLARRQAGALHAVLRVCLALGRALLPLIAILALVFLPTLLFTGLQPLWDTRNATALLLTLTFGTVALVNGVLHDGSGVAGYRTGLRRLMGAALLTLPAYAVLAMVALGLRVSQYAWTVERLWAAVLVFVATAYAFGYALSVLVPRQGERFGYLAPVNRALALLLAAVLLATQSPLLDLRAITVSSQLARHHADLEKLDLAHLRFDLGRDGYEALQALRDDPRVTASATLATHVREALEAENRWALKHPAAPLPASVAVVPAGTPVPEGLLAFINDSRRGRNYLRATDCAQCILLAADFGGDPALEWVLVNTARHHAPFLVFGQRAGQWAVVGHLSAQGLGEDTLEALRQGRVELAEPQWRDLVVGDRRLRFQPEGR